MVNAGFTHQDGVTSLREAERRLILSYAPTYARDALSALLALDDALARIVQTTREPMVGQMRLTWWHDALMRLDDAPPHAEPVLVALAGSVLPIVSGKALAALVDGWEELLEPGTLDTAALLRFADARGGRLFGAAGRVLGAAPGDPVAIAGQGWALADLAAHSGDAVLTQAASAQAQPRLVAACRRRWSRPARALGAMAHLARLNGRGAARRTLRALAHRLTGF